MSYQFYPHWNQEVVFSPAGPQPHPLFASEQLKVVLAGLEAGQSIPQHPEGLSVYYFVEGQGTMLVDGEPVEVASGSTLILPAGSVRGLEAKTRLVFLATRVAGF